MTRTPILARVVFVSNRWPRYTILRRVSVVDRKSVSAFPVINCLAKTTWEARARFAKSHTLNGHQAR
jgi:hypothetical protein